MDPAITKETCSVSNSPSRDYLIRNGINISEEIEKYLDNLSSKNVEFVDPKLKRERQKLQDLLTSYKKLSEQLDRKCEEASKEGIHVPTKEILARRAEIYALLHPELYKNRREEEKKELIEKISCRRHFNEVDKVCPRDITPIHCMPDKGQQEKDRFCKLLASAPSRFHNALSQPTRRFSRLTRPPTTPPCHVDVRENEKERLARIFATSAAFIRDPNLKKKILRKYKEVNRPSAQNTPKDSHRQLPRGAESDVCRGAQLAPSQENAASKLTSDLNNMVRNGEYLPPNKYSSHLQGHTALGEWEHDARREHLSDERQYEYLKHTEQNNMVRNGEYLPLNKYSSPLQGRTVLGEWEHDARREHLSDERQYEYLKHTEQENQAKVDKGVMVCSPNGRRSVSSASTQTDDESPIQASPSKSSPREFVESSPREKLLSDLYGYRPSCDLAQDKKSKQIAYAQALQEQIKEKKRLDEERKRLEKEEEELEEKRFNEQSERIQKECGHKRTVDLDKFIQNDMLRNGEYLPPNKYSSHLQGHTALGEWEHDARREHLSDERQYEYLKHTEQRQADEELLWKRLAEMNLEAKELKRKERVGRLSNKRDDSPEGSVSDYPNLVSLYRRLQDQEIGGRVLDRELAGTSSASVLPEQLPEANFEEDRSRMTGLGVDLLREHRSQKERLQLPPVVDTTAKIERKKPTSRELPSHPAIGYVPSSVNDARCHKQNYRQQADTVLHAPLDEEVAQSEGTAQRSACLLPSPQRSRSPVLPAIRTGSMLKRNSRILDNDSKVPQECSRGLEQTVVDKRNILTQLGAFRRQLAQEHHKLEERIRGQSTS